MRLSRFHYLVFCAILASIVLPSCREEEEEGVRGLQAEDFYPRYNKIIREWLAQEADKERKEIVAIEEKLAVETDAEKIKTLEGLRIDHQRALERNEYRLALGDYYNFKTPADIPQDLVWENGMDQPDVGSPEAKKGGTFRYFVVSFPPTVRGFGANSNNSSRGDIYDLIEVGLINLHPVTQKTIPGIAQEWAIGSDGRTVYFKIHPEAKFNDGVPIVAEDFLTFSVLRLSDYVDSIYFKQYLREQFAQFTIYDDKTLSITLPEPKPVELMPYYCNLPPAATHFYKNDFGPDFEERFQWVVPPTTAPYRLKPEDLVKGESYTLTRVDDWWLKDKKYYRNLFNADRLSYRVIRDIPKAWDVFCAGELDYFPITLPLFYYDKSEIDVVFNGYVERTTWYNTYPRIPFGLYLNTAEEPLDDPNIRRGIAYAANWEKVIDVIFRGDASRLPSYTSGYGAITNPNVSAKPFSVKKAREAFAAAGYSKEDKDGILMDASGKRLEIELTFGNTPDRVAVATKLMQEARKAGLAISLDAVDAMSSYRKAMSKEHQMLYTAWQFTPPVPAYYEYFHSRNAFDEKGNRKQQTNNVFSYANDRMDKLTEATRNARTTEEFIKAAHEIQEIVADENLFIPGYMIDFSRVANWRWVRWPDTEETRFATPLSYIPLESYCYWIDEEMKEETLKAKREGKVFPEVDRLVDDYRESPAEEAPTNPIGEEVPLNNHDSALLPIQEEVEVEVEVEGGAE